LMVGPRWGAGAVSGGALGVVWGMGAGLGISSGIVIPLLQ
jgi:hypothetical protein